jgi:hypothetical protein
MLRCVIRVPVPATLGDLYPMVSAVSASGTAGMALCRFTDDVAGDIPFACHMASLGGIAWRRMWRMHRLIGPAIFCTAVI